MSKPLVAADRGANLVNTMWNCATCGANLLDQTTTCVVCNSDAPERSAADREWTDRDGRQYSPSPPAKLTWRSGLVLITGFGTLGAILAPYIIIAFSTVPILLLVHFAFVVPAIALLNLVLVVAGVFQYKSSALKYDFALAIAVALGWLLVVLML